MRQEEKEMSAATLAPRTIDVEALGRDVTAYMMGSKEPIRAFEQALGALRVPGDAKEMAAALGRELGWLRLVSRIQGEAPRVPLLAVVTRVLRRHC